MEQKGLGKGVLPMQRSVNNNGFICVWQQDMVIKSIVVPL